ncbi:MAG: aromatic ring-hydroxylating dioxygenase subunit alpha [Actinomycetia bacterium]|nr:aromatic ring-hydroxylating dioxygenase subunit alpha [Actinomycetes bacterium]
MISSGDWLADTAWAGTRRPLTEATGLPPGAYTDDDFFALERERVFERAWVCIGTTPEVAEPGRLLVRSVGRTSILVVRGHDGVVRGFLNACRHRGTEIVDTDTDGVTVIRCPYHRWGYDLAGSLIATPRFNDVPRAHFDPADFGLLPVRVEAWGCLLFACLDPATRPLDEWLGDLSDRTVGYELDAWWLHEQLDLEIGANWKLISENYQEYYHLAWVHPELAKVSRVEDHYRYQGSGLYCGQTTTPVSGDSRDDWMLLPAAAGLDESDSVSGRFVTIFPNVLLSILPNHVFVMRLEPVAPGLTREHCTFLLPPSTECPSAPDFESTRSFWLDVNNEDIDIVQRSQRGLTTVGVPAGPLAPRFEEPLHRFHQILADCMTLDSLATIPVPAGDRPDNPDDQWGSGTNPIPAAIDARSHPP